MSAGSGLRPPSRVTCGARDNKAVLTARARGRHRDARADRSRESADRGDRTRAAARAPTRPRRTG
eukprot:3350016-Prymnesium_polylepis.1